MRTMRKCVARVLSKAGQPRDEKKRSSPSPKQLACSSGILAGCGVGAFDCLLDIEAGEAKHLVSLKSYEMLPNPVHPPNLTS